MSELKYKTSQKLFNKSKNRHYKSFGDLLILGDAKLDGDLACYKVYCFGEEKPVDMINEKELDYHFSTSKTKTEKIEEPKNSMNIEENKHHLLWEGMQSIDVMKLILSKEEYIGFLKGQIIKYQLRLGKKDDPTKEIRKIKDYTDELNKVL